MSKHWILFVALAVVGCRMPDGWGVSFGYSETDWDIDGSDRHGISGGATSVMVTPFWHAGEHLRRLRREEERERMLHAARAARGEVEPLAADHSVHIDLSDETRVEGGGAEVVTELEASLDADASSETAVDVQDEAPPEGDGGDEGHGIIPKVPDDIEGGLGVLMWGGAVLLACCGLWVLSKTPFLKRFFK